MADGGIVTLENPATQGIGLARGRSAQSCPALPEGTVLVAADTHWSLAGDIWHQRFPAALRDSAPRVRWLGDFLFVGFDNQANHETYHPALIQVAKSVDDCRGATDLAARLAEMDAEGVAMEIAFPQRIQGFFHHGDFEVRDLIFRIYNEHLAELSEQSGNRFHGVAIANWWKPAKARASIQEIKALGLKTFMIPQSPGKNEAGEPIYYASEEMEPFWSAAEEAGLPVCFHVAEDLKGGGPGFLGAMSLHNLGPFRRNLGELIFGGVLDRHPDLRIVFSEAGINWVPGALQDAELICDSFDELLEPKIAHRPSHYWHKNCYATFMNDAVGLRLLDMVGADRVMWSTDYPHNEGTFGYTGASVQSILDAVSPDDARRILGGTAIDLFALPRS
jgi:predicted TIM-barrel fold metal-dependent hydrolase